MREYHKINTIYKRNMEAKGNPIIIGEYSCPEFAYLADNQWVWTEKVDGTNIRVMFKDGGLTFGGKTDNAQIPAPLVNVLHNMFFPHLDIFKVLFPEGACLYGEGYGAKIQKGGGNYRLDQSFVLFDIKIGEWWLRRGDMEDIAAQLSLDFVPVIGSGTLKELTEYVRAGFESAWGFFPAEGVVARPSVELKTRNGGRIITKLKHRDFRVIYGE